jgi:hypothetical protein
LFCWARWGLRGFWHTSRSVHLTVRLDFWRFWATGGVGMMDTPIECDGFALVDGSLGLVFRDWTGWNST